MNKPLGKWAKITYAILWIILAALVVFYLYRDFSSHIVPAPQLPSNVTVYPPGTYPEDMSHKKLPSATDDPHWMDRNVDTSNWKIYSDNTHGIQFKYPPTWNAVRLSDTKVGVENPGDIRPATDEGPVPLTILIDPSFSSPNYPIATSSTDLNALGAMFTGLPPNDLSAKDLSSSEDNVRRLLFYDVAGDPDRMSGVVIKNNTAYTVELWYSTVDEDSGHYSDDELDAFIGIFSTFKFTG